MFTGLNQADTQQPSHSNNINKITLPIHNPSLALSKAVIPPTKGGGKAPSKSKKGSKVQAPLTPEGKEEQKVLKALSNKFWADERKRRKKEADNKVFSHNGEIKTKVVFGPKQEDVERHLVVQDPNLVVVDPPQGIVGVEEVPLVELKPKKIKKVIRFDLGDRELFFEDVHKRLVEPTLREDEDWLVRDEVFEDVRLPQFYYFKRHYQPCRVKLSPFLYRFIKTKLLCLPDEARNFTVCCNFAAEHLYMLPATFVEQNMAFFAHKLSTHSTPSGLTSYVPYDLGLSVNLVVPVVKETTVGDRPFGYAYTGSWRIIKQKGFNFRLTADGLVESISFDTVHPPPLTHRGMTQYFSFTPQNQFVILNNSGRNICDALSRYFKASYPGEEHARRQRQLELMNGIPMSTIADCARICGGRLASRTYTTRIGRRYYLNSAASKTFVNMLNSVFSETFWYYLAILYMFYIAWDKYKGSWNGVVYYAYAPFYQFYDYLPLISSVVTLPHPKRLLYQRFVEAIDTSYKVVKAIGSFESKLKYELAKTKPDGVAPGRLYATGSHLALVDYYIAGWVVWLLGKKEISLERSLGGYFVTFMFMYCDTQEAAASDAMFHKIMNLPRNTICYVYFSDDGYIASNLEGEIKIFETDFSCCDSTNGFAMMVAIVHFSNQCYQGARALQMLSLFSRSTILYNPDTARARTPTEFVELEPEDAFEYSGHGWTSLNNDMAQLATGSKLVDLMSARNTLEFDCDIIEKAAYECGYKMTVVQRNSYNSSTFLKRAYSERNGRSWLVYGAILRSWGLVEGDPSADAFGLSHRRFKLTSDQDLAEILMKQRVQGLVNEPPSPLIEAMRIRVKLQEEPREYLVDYSDLNDRYGTETWEWQPLLDAIMDLRMGDVITCAALEKVFSVDYGTTPVFEDDISVIRLGTSKANELI